MKKIAAALAALALLAALGGCGGGAASSGVQSVPGPSGAAPPASAPAPAAQPGPLRFLCPPDALRFTGAPGEGGYYLRQTEETGDTGMVDYRWQVFWVDYASRQKSLLCGRSGCRHTVEDCSATFGAQDGPPVFFPWEEGLVVCLARSIKLATNGGQSWKTLLTAEHIARAAGIWQPEGQAVLGKALFSDGVYLYADIGMAPARERPGDLSLAPQTAMVKIQLSNCEVSLVSPGPIAEDLGPALGALGGEMLFACGGFAPGNPGRLLAHNPATNAQRTLLEGLELYGADANGESLLVDGEYVYYLPLAGGLWRCHLATGAREEILAALPGRGYYALRGMYGGRLALACRPEGPPEALAIHPETGEAAPFPLARQGGYVFLFDEADGHYLVASEIGIANGLSSHFSPSNVVLQYALIPSGDYWAGRPNYQPIVNVE